jgi:tRNA A-37 threonylcarbamoyl transferase component Bud32
VILREDAREAALRLGFAIVPWLDAGDMELKLGDTVGDRYHVDRLLGEGGMGVVYAATHAVTRRRVALKVLRGYYAADTTTRQRFLREARAACAVRHPNVVQIHDVIEIDGGSPAMVMELLEGETLARKLERDGRLGVEELARLMLPVLSAVGTAHEIGIVHRDLKPENIFLAKTRDGGVDVKVLDFGVAKLTATEGDAARSGALTGTGSMLGTPFYMSPEQGFGEKDIDHRADIWSLGVIFYECLSGVRPTQAENIGQIFKIVMTDAIKPLGERVPELPHPITDLVARMLQRERASRPADLREVVDVLAAFGTRESPSFGAPKEVETARVSSAATTLSPPVAAGLPVEAERPGDGARTNGAMASPAVTPATRRRRGSVALVVCLLAGGAAVGVWRLRGTGEHVAATTSAVVDPEPPVLPVAMSVAAAVAPPAPEPAPPPASASASAQASAPPPKTAPAPLQRANAPAAAVAPATPAVRASAPPARRSPAPIASATPAPESKANVDPGSYQ